MTFEQRLAKKEEKTKNTLLALLLMQMKSMKKEVMRKKIEENKARKSENEKKSEQFQVIKNPAKIKGMKRKQLRQLEKRDLLAKS
jgi:rRNA-processing protein CGR1